MQVTAVLLHAVEMPDISLNAGLVTVALTELVFRCFSEGAWFDHACCILCKYTQVHFLLIQNKQLSCVAQCISDSCIALLLLFVMCHCELLLMQVPVTFIYGEGDWMDPKGGARVCKEIREERGQLSPADLLVTSIPQAGHYPFLDQPDLFMKALLEHTKPYRCSQAWSTC